MSAEDKREIIGTNRKARFNFSILETFEAGLVLKGTEVKSLRQRKVDFAESFARPRGSEMFLLGLHIAPYEHGNIQNHEPRRPRKLLLHRRQLDRLIGSVQQKGTVLVPLSMYFKNGFAKVELGLGRGKRKVDKREDIKEREAKRDIARAMSIRRG